MPRATRIEAVIESASRRSLLLLVFEHAAYPCAALLAGTAILLLFGTDILHWYWPVVLAGAAAVIAAARMRRAILPRYRVAQLLDKRLGLNDSLATAWYLLSQRRLAHRKATVDSAAAEFQIEQAEQVAASIEPAAALPFTGQRRWAATACIAVVTVALFTARYFKIESLSLRAPLIPIHTAVVLDLEHLLSPHLGWLPFGTRVHQQVAAGGHRAGEQERATGEASQPGDASQAKSSQSRSGRQASQKASRNRQASENSANRDAAQRAQDSTSSLLRRMKDGLASLMAQMRGNGKRSSQNNSQTGNHPSSHGSNSMANRQANGKNEANAQAQIQAAQKASSALRNAQSSARKGSDAQSGIGKQNGNKDLRRAQELAAMGKLAEILGKRSADLTGDMSVRTASGGSQVQTPYTQQVARHEDLGGEIHRDEVPAIYRDYVRRYMEEVHRNSQPEDTDQ